MKRLPLAAVLCLAAACSSLKTKVDYDTEADFRGLESYAWVEVAEPELSLNAQRARRAVELSLAARGFAADPAQPDFLVHVEVGSTERTQVTDHGYTYSRWGAWYGGRDIDVYRYTEGNLILDVVDPAKNELIWRGTATKVVDESWSPQEIEAEIRTAVEALLEDFPPRG